MEHKPKKTSLSKNETNIKATIYWFPRWNGNKYTWSKCMTEKEVIKLCQ
jgi:hypothetical protein